MSRFSDLYTPKEIKQEEKIEQTNPKSVSVVSSIKNKRNITKDKI